MAELPRHNSGLRWHKSLQLPENNVSRLWVRVKVEFSHAGRVADGLHAAAHHVDVSNFGDEVSVQLGAEGRVGERTQMDQVDFS